jgi:DNA-binding winged helix-turn-helix (wHTH) protein
MTHLFTLINEHQDAMVSAPVRLLRLLVREDDSMVRKQMLRQKLLIGRLVARLTVE